MSWKPAVLLYRRGQIREVELAQEDAIIHCKLKQKECYALIDWRNGEFEVRSSSLKRFLGRAIAVAGFYEIEEIVAEEISPVPDFLEADPVDGEENNRNPAEEAGQHKVIEVARPLDLWLELGYKGLTLTARWENEDGSHSAALKAPPPNRFPNRREREQVIRLAGLAHRSGFQFVKSQAVYRLRSLEMVPFFISKTLNDWRQHFKIGMDSAMEKRAKVLRKVDVEVVAKSLENFQTHFHWKFSVGGRHLAEEDRQNLLNKGQMVHFVPNIGIVRIGQPQGKILREFKESLSILTEGEFPRYLLLSLFGRKYLKVSVSEELSLWRKQLKVSGNSIGDEELPGFLRDYQRHGVRWFAHLCDVDCHGLLADEMGLGKTLQLATLIKKRPGKGLPHLIVCPASVVPVWQSEFDRWFPGTEIEVLRNGNDFRENSGAKIWLASYTQLRLHKHLLTEIEFGYAVLDEAQSIKNPDAKTSQACYAVRAKHRMALTGTPLENRQQDLWSIFRFLMPGMLGGRRGFADNITGDPQNFFKRLNQQLAPFVLRRTKKEVAKELPEKIEAPLLCPMTELQKRQYTALTSEGIKNLGNDIDQILRKKNFNLLALLTRLRQVCCDPGLLPWQTTGIEHSGKINTLLERLDGVLGNGHKVVVFSQFVTFLDRIKEALKMELPEYEVFELRGSTTNRDKPVAEFQKHQKAALMLVSLKAGGTGITLHAADYVFLMDPWWNPAVEDQAIDRVHRIGQDKTVFVYRLVTQGTIEERIMDLKESKRALFDQVIGSLNEISDFKSYFHKLSDLISISSS